MFSSHYGGTIDRIRVKSAAKSRRSILSVSTHAAKRETHKRRIFEAVNSLNDEELQKVSSML